MVCFDAFYFPTTVKSTPPWFDNTTPISETKRFGEGVDNWKFMKKYSEGNDESVNRQTFEMKVFLKETMIIGGQTMGEEIRPKNVLLINLATK